MASWSGNNGRQNEELIGTDERIREERKETAGAALNAQLRPLFFRR